MENKNIKVVCIEPIKNLILHKVYDAVVVSDWDSPLCYRLKNEKGNKFSYHHSSFATLKEYRKIKLEKINESR